LMARQADGLSISRAVDLWNEKLASGSDPLADSVPSTSPTLTPSGSAEGLYCLYNEYVMDYLSDACHIKSHEFGVNYTNRNSKV